MSFTSGIASHLMRATTVAALIGACVSPVLAQPPAAPTPAPSTPAPPAPPITWNAQLEVNYTANFNKPFNGSNTYLFNTKEGQFALNLAELKASKAATPESRTGFTVRLIEGEVRSLRTFNAGEYGGTLPNVLEAYGTFLAPIGGKDVKVDVGQFVTHVGYETIDIGTNNFFSRSFVFQFPEPLYNGGVRAAYPVSPKTTISGFVLNRYNGVNDTGNRDVAPGFQIAQTFSPTSSLTLNGLYSRENLAYTAANQPGADLSPLKNSKPLGILDLIYTGQFGPTFKVAAEGVYRFGKVPTGETGKDELSYNVVGGALYLIAPFKNGNTAALRIETLSQSKTGAGVLPLETDSDKKPSISSATASYEFHWGFLPGLRTIFEYRYDVANTKVFPGEDSGNFKKNQSTITIGQVYAF